MFTLTYHWNICLSEENLKTTSQKMALSLRVDVVATLARCNLRDRLQSIMASFLLRPPFFFVLRLPSGHPQGDSLLRIPTTNSAFLESPCAQAWNP